MTTNDDQPRESEPKLEPGDRVGLGRVVRDHDAAAGLHPPADDVEEASSESFPASDPPAFSRAQSARGDSGAQDRADPELPDPRDVP